MDYVDSVITFDDDGFRRRVACLCVRSIDELEVLLISDRSKDPATWVVPEGDVGPKESVPKAAVRAVKEKVGASGYLIRRLDNLEDPVKRTRTTIYAFLVLDVMLEVAEEHQGYLTGINKEWFNLKDAFLKLNHEMMQKEYLKMLKSYNENLFQ